MKIITKFLSTKNTKYSKIRNLPGDPSFQDSCNVARNKSVIPSFEYIDEQRLDDAEVGSLRQRSFKLADKQQLSESKRNSRSVDNLNRNDCKLIIHFRFDVLK